MSGRRAEDVGLSLLPARTPLPQRPWVRHLAVDADLAEVASAKALLVTLSLGLRRPQRCGVSGEDVVQTSLTEA